MKINDFLFLFLSLFSDVYRRPPGLQNSLWNAMQSEFQSKSIWLYLLSLVTKILKYSKVAKIRIQLHLGFYPIVFEIFQDMVFWYQNCSDFPGVFSDLICTLEHLGFKLEKNNWDLGTYRKSWKINYFLSFQKSIGDLLVQMATIYKASTHRSTILIDRNLMPTLMSTFTRLLDIQLDLFISYKSQNVFENKSYYFIVYQPNLIF